MIILNYDKILFYTNIWFIQKFLLFLKVVEFWNYLSLIASFCSNDLCSSNANKHCNYLIIFGYTNRNDINFDYI